jgi:hypothetical protein
MSEKPRHASTVKREILDELKKDGHDSTRAEQLLRTMEQILATMKEHCQVIEQRCRTKRVRKEIHPTDVFAAHLRDAKPVSIKQTGGFH